MVSRFIKDTIKYKNYIVYSARADLKSEVTNAYLDWFWWILEPVCDMLIFFFIFGYVFHNDEQYYLIFLFSSLTMWNFFNKVALTSVSLIRNTKGVISRVYIPKTVLLLEKMLVNAFKMLISSIIVVLLMVIYRVGIDWHLSGVIPVLISFFILSYGLGCLLMHYGVYVDDLSYIVSILLRMLFYFTGIFYSIATSIPQPFGTIIERANPIAFLIMCMRNSVLYKKNYSFSGYLVWTAISIVVFLIGISTIYKNENSYVKVI